MSDRDAVLRKASKLLAFQAGTATPAEVELAAQRLGELLHAHNLTLQDVRVEALRSGIRTEETSSGFAQRPRWVRDLAAGVAYACSCQVLYRQRYEDARLRLADTESFIGHEADVAVARYFYDVLIQQLPAMASAHARSLPPGDRPRAKRSFLVGIVHTVVSRLSAMLRPVADISGCPGTPGLTLIAAKRQAIDAFLAQTYPDLRTTSWRRLRMDQVDMLALRAGVRAGRDVALHHGVRSETPAHVLACSSP